MEVPVRLRAWVSPRGRPAYGEPGGISSQSIASPSMRCRSSASRPAIRAAPRISPSVSASSSVS
jgi:hypothetical protein